MRPAYSLVTFGDLTSIAGRRSDASFRSGDSEPGAPSSGKIGARFAVGEQCVELGVKLRRLPRD